jgi:hypothetical protein
MPVTVNAQLDQDSGSPTWLAGGINLAAVLRNYSVADAQTEPRPLACFLRGEEGIKYAGQVFGRDTWAIIGE